MKHPIRILLCLLLLVAAGRTTAQTSDEVRNVIFLIGDGMGLSHLSMLEIESDYQPTAFSRAEHLALVTTRSANNRVTDSAAAGTALATGHKTNNSMLGLAPDSSRLTSMMELARDRGLATGIVVSCHLTHATPGAFYAHRPKRSQYAEIAEQLLESNFDVLIGGGARWLGAPVGGDSTAAAGTYFDAFARKGYRVVRSLEETADLHEGRLLAVLADEHLPNAVERGNELEQGTRKALELLSQDPDGFLLMVEGSLIDYAGHANHASWLLAEMRDFERVVATAMDFADTHPGTLVVVTADHETGGLTMPSGKSDFTLSESGIDYRFSTKSHSAIRVPAYFYGTGSDRFRPMLENCELSQRIMELLRLKPAEPCLP